LNQTLEAYRAGGGGGKPNPAQMTEQDEREAFSLLKQKHPDW